jgi:hypothetical protein
MICPVNETLTVLVPSEIWSTVICCVTALYVAVTDGEISHGEVVPEEPNSPDVPVTDVVKYELGMV